MDLDYYYYHSILFVAFSTLVNSLHSINNIANILMSTILQLKRRHLYKYPHILKIHTNVKVHLTLFIISIDY